VERRFEIVERWCSIALNSILSADGGVNSGKFGRKMIMAAIELKDAKKAKGSFALMPETAQNEMLTQFLMFKVSLIDWDHQLGYQCLMNISNGSNEAQSRDMLYTCLKEAQQAGDRICTLSTLRAVAKGWNTKQLSVPELPSVLRCSIRLINWLISEDQSKEASGLDETLAEDTCQVFEIGKFPLSAFLLC
jgi:hypothetical protein